MVTGLNSCAEENCFKKWYSAARGQNKVVDSRCAIGLVDAPFTVCTNKVDLVITYISMNFNCIILD